MSGREIDYFVTIDLAVPDLHHSGTRYPKPSAYFQKVCNTPKLKP